MSGRPGGPSDPRRATPGRRARASARQARDRVDAARAKAEAVRQQLERRRPGNRWIDAAFVAIERDARTGGGVLAAALAFRCFTFLIPFVFVIVTGMPFLGDATRADPKDLADTFGMSGLIARAIGHAGDLSVWNRTWLLVVSGIALVFAARGLVRVLRITHGLAWNVPVPRLQRPFTAAGLLIGAMAAILAVGALIERVQDAVGLLRVIPFLAWGVLVVGIWTAVQARLPHADVP